jgi:hypothetical protein
VEAAGASLRFAVTGPSGASALDFGRPLTGGGMDALRSTLHDVLVGPTRQAGALLAPFGIRFLVAGSADLPAAAIVRLTDQVDLSSIRAGDLLVFQNPTAVPLASVIDDPSWAIAASSGDPTAVAQLLPADPSPLDGTQEPYVAPPGGSSAGFAYLSQEFDSRWRLTSGAAAAIGPGRAFGWAIRFPVGADVSSAGFTIDATDQWIRTLEVTLLALLWLAALWVTRRPPKAVG